MHVREIKMDTMEHITEWSTPFPDLKATVEDWTTWMNALTEHINKHNQISIYTKDELEYLNKLRRYVAHAYTKIQQLEYN